MKRNWKRERDYWLDRVGQYHPGNRRRSDSLRIVPADYAAIPPPVNPPVPLGQPCLVWRWQLRGGGYGALNGRGAHVLAFEQSRGRSLQDGMQVNHLCSRPFCIQPAHLYEGTALQNARDRRAELRRGRYVNWREAAHRLERALDGVYWPAPETDARAAGWKEPLECPHADLPEMFESRGVRGVRVCVNCGEMRLTRGGVEVRIRQPCDSNRRQRGLEETAGEAARYNVL